MLADQTVWSLYLNAMYSFLIGTLAFRNPKEVRDHVTMIMSTPPPGPNYRWLQPLLHMVTASITYGYSLCHI